MKIFLFTSEIRDTFMEERGNSIRKMINPQQKQRFVLVFHVPFLHFILWYRGFSQGF